MLIKYVQSKLDFAILVNFMRGKFDAIALCWLNFVFAQSAVQVDVVPPLVDISALWRRIIEGIVADPSLLFSLFHPTHPAITF